MKKIFLIIITLTLLPTAYAEDTCWGNNCEKLPRAGQPSKEKTKKLLDKYKKDKDTSKKEIETDYEETCWKVGNKLRCKIKESRK